MGPRTVGPVRVPRPDTLFETELSRRSILPTSTPWAVPDRVTSYTPRISLSREKGVLDNDSKHVTRSVNVFVNLEVVLCSKDRTRTTETDISPHVLRTTRTKILSGVLVESLRRRGTDSGHSLTRDVQQRCYWFVVVSRDIGHLKDIDQWTYRFGHNDGPEKTVLLELTRSRLGQRMTFL